MLKNRDANQRRWITLGLLLLLSSGGGCAASVLHLTEHVPCATAGPKRLPCYHGPCCGVIFAKFGYERRCEIECAGPRPLYGFHASCWRHWPCDSILCEAIPNDATPTDAAPTEVVPQEAEPSEVTPYDAMLFPPPADRVEVDEPQESPLDVEPVGNWEDDPLEFLPEPVPYLPEPLPPDDFEVPPAPSIGE